MTDTEGGALSAAGGWTLTFSQEMEIRLDTPYLPRFHPCDQGVPLDVEKDGKAYVCRKSRVGGLRSPPPHRTEHLFKGRLQLRLARETVTVIAKNEAVGNLPIQLLEDAIDAAGTGRLPANAL